MNLRINKVDKHDSLVLHL